MLNRSGHLSLSYESNVINQFPNRNDVLFDRSTRRQPVRNRGTGSCGKRAADARSAWMPTIRTSGRRRLAANATPPDQGGVAHWYPGLRNIRQLVDYFDGSGRCSGGNVWIGGVVQQKATSLLGIVCALRRLERCLLRAQRSLRHMLVFELVWWGLR